MTSNSGLARQDTDYTKHIQEVLNELRQMQQTPQLVTSPDELEALERKIRQCTDRLGSLLVGYHMQQALDSVALQAAQAQLVRQWPKPLKNDGKVTVMVHTVQGLAVPVRVTYYRRTGQRRAGKRSAGVYAGLVLLGIYDRYTPAFAAEVSLLADPESLRRNGLPVKLIDRALVMRHEHLAGSPVELLEGPETAPRSNDVLHHPPEAFDRIEVVATMGRQAMPAQLAVVVVACRVELVRALHPAAINDHHDVCAGFAERRHDLMEILAQLLGIKVGHDFRLAFRTSCLGFERR